MDDYQQERLLTSIEGEFREALEAKNDGRMLDDDDLAFEFMRHVKAHLNSILHGPVCINVPPPQVEAPRAVSLA